MIACFVPIIIFCNVLLRRPAHYVAYKYHNDI